MFVRTEGSPPARFLRALKMGQGPVALEAAGEMEVIRLDDALKLTLLLVDQRELFERFAARWIARFGMEVPGLRIADAALAASALAAIRKGEAAGAVALAELCDERGRRDLTIVLEEWCEPWRV
jgi:hypothetical protein